jgi:hypothetical protein
MNKIVYLHRKKTNNEIFYVGMGNSKRVYSRQRSKFWEDTVKKYGYYSVIIADNLSKDDALELECFIIKELGRKDLKTGPLVNMTDGGDGASGLNCSIEKRRKYKMSKVKRNSEWKRKISEAHKGKVFSKETLEKMSKAKLGSKVSEDVRKKMSESNRSEEIGGIKVSMFCFHTGELLKNFNSIKKASIYINRPITCITNQMKGLSKSTSFKSTNQKVIFKKQTNE